MLPLVRAVASEVIERRAEFKAIRAELALVNAARSPEGLSVARSDLEARLFDQEDAIFSACAELEGLGMDVHRLRPLVVHFPGVEAGQAVNFCWREGESTIATRHPVSNDDVPSCTDDQALSTVG